MRSGLAAAQPGARRLHRLALAGAVAGALAVVASLLPAWLGYQPREDASGGLALVSMAGAASEAGPEVTMPVLVIDVPHLASMIEVTGSTAGRLMLLGIPALGLLAASLLQQAGYRWPADRVPALPHSLPASHRSMFPRGAAPTRPSDRRPVEASRPSSRPSVAWLAILAAALALLGLVARRPDPRG